MLYGGISRLSAIIVFYRKCNFIITDELFNRKMWRKRKHPPKRDSQGKFAEKCSPPRKKYKYLNSAKKAIKEVNLRHILLNFFRSFTYPLFTPNRLDKEEVQRLSKLFIMLVLNLILKFTTNFICPSL